MLRSSFFMGAIQRTAIGCLLFFVEEDKNFKKSFSFFDTRRPPANDYRYGGVFR